MSSLAETRNMKFGLRSLRVMFVAAAHVPTYGTFSSWNTGSIARPTGECRPPNTATAFSRSMTSRAAVTPLDGLPSSSRTTSSILRPPSAGVAKVSAPLSRSFYAEAAGELIWIGDPETLLHPRAVLATDVIVPAAGANVYVTLDRAVSWQPFGARMTRDTAMSAHTL